MRRIFFCYSKPFLSYSTLTSGLKWYCDVTDFSENGLQFFRTLRILGQDKSLNDVHCSTNEIEKTYFTHQRHWLKEIAILYQPWTEDSSWMLANVTDWAVCISGRLLNTLDTYNKKKLITILLIGLFNSVQLTGGHVFAIGLGGGLDLGRDPRSFLVENDCGSGLNTGFGLSDCGVMGVLNRLASAEKKITSVVHVWV